jgi:hypothetical protein
MAIHDSRARRVLDYLANRLEAKDYVALDAAISASGGYTAIGLDGNGVTFDRSKGTTLAQDKAFAERYPDADKIRVTGF